MKLIEFLKELDEWLDDVFPLWDVVKFLLAFAIISFLWKLL